MSERGGAVVTAQALVSYASTMGGGWSLGLLAAVFAVALAAVAIGWAARFSEHGCA